MKGIMLDLVEQAQLAFSDLISVVDSLHEKLPTGQDAIISRRIHLAKSLGQSSLDKLKHCLEVGEDAEEGD